MSKTDVLELLKSNLDEKRYNHSIGTAECAASLAQKFNLNVQKCYETGLLHDCAKCYDNEQMLYIMKNYTDADEEELKNPKTWHAPVSAYVAERDYKITDEEILTAIRWHTLGRLDMTDFDKVVFLADKIENRTRKKKYIESVKEVLDESNGLNKAVLICYKETIKSLVERNLRICPLTIDIYNKLQETINVK